MFKAICPALLTLFLIWRKFYFDSALKRPISSACLPLQILQNHMDHLSTLLGPFPEFWKEPSKWGVLIIDAWVSSQWICLCFSHIIPLFVLFSARLVFSISYMWALSHLISCSCHSFLHLVCLFPESMASLSSLLSGGVFSSLLLPDHCPSLIPKTSNSFELTPSDSATHRPSSQQLSQISGSWSLDHSLNI